MKLLRFLVHKQALLDAVRLFRSTRVPASLKLITIALAVLIISPLNILGDIPFLGVIDDVALIGLLLNWFLRSAAAHDEPLTIEAT
jgi:uncharacterized membrane protein YkvA (DUF1232 family)